MSFLIGSLVTVVLAVALRRLYVVRKTRKLVEAFIEERLAEVLRVPLDCPPFDRQEVIFDDEDSTPLLTELNMEIIVNKWDELWPLAYTAIDRRAKEMNSREYLTEEMEITVNLPADRMASHSRWFIEIRSAGGIYAAELIGSEVTDCTATF